ncbi:MAG TPA: hypothetical protein PLM53_05085 [Spirochaetota bacterium]|nr:hypothetical protein [Spirochaetota bacterium]HPC40598.1 hypothetical protein [Spirochaetota bacterium]HPL18191.1 hypothetical protein [Spirochaetota bacterium]HQF07894.1 hypothetical protein [Spirochaetota bacterium]HQH96453.1 hypothetical protein [Spirochaetota bacterium]
MKNFLIKTIAVVFVVGIVYGLFFSVEKIDAGTLCVVQDLRSKTVVRVARPIVGNYAFVWQGALPWWFSISNLPVRRSAGITVKISFPELSLLKDDNYHLWVPLRVVYRIDGDSFAETARLGDGGRGLDELVTALFQGELQEELHPLLAPAYQREVLAAQLAPAIERAAKKLEGDFKTSGIKLVSAKMSGTPVLPEKAVYNEAVIHAADLRKMNRAREMDLIGIQASLERDKLKNEQFYANLLRISTIISANPDILKYIYIDKLGANVNVILSSDSSGIPRMLEKSDKPVKGKPKEIDNLR